MTQTHLISAPPPEEQKHLLEHLIGSISPDFIPLKHGTAFLAAPPYIDPDILRYCLFLNETLQPSTVRQYLYEIKILLNFLQARGNSWETVSEDDLRYYRRYRTNPATDSAVGERSWRRSAGAIKGFIDFMMLQGRISVNPAPKIGNRSVLTPKQRRYPANVRSLPKDKVARFFQEGLGALPSYGAPTRIRNQALGQLMLRSGMRISEAVNLLTTDLELAQASEGIMTLEAVTKRQIMRHITITSGMSAYLQMYIQTERAHVVSMCQKSLERRTDLLEVHEISDGNIYGVIAGDSVRYRLSRLPIVLRRKAVKRLDTHIEPLGLFLGTRQALPLGVAAWHKVFRRANDQVRVGDTNWVSIRSHDLRHTYATNTLSAATALAAKRGSDGLSLAYQLTLDPLGEVQRQLGHASPNTTAQYLRQPYSADGSLAREIDAWVENEGSEASHEKL